MLKTIKTIDKILGVILSLILDLIPILIATILSLFSCIEALLRGKPGKALLKLIFAPFIALFILAQGIAVSLIAVWHMGFIGTLTTKPRVWWYMAGCLLTRPSFSYKMML